MENKMNEILNVLHKWDNKRINILKNGTIQICHVPHVASQAWLHKIYNGLADEQIDKIEDELNLKIPIDFREFYKICNGINIFSNSLSISGMKLSYERTGEEAIQPYCIIVTNYGRPEGCPDSWIFFGSYQWDGSKVFFDLKNGLDSSKVYYSEEDSLEIKKEWPDFYTFLLDETQRLSELFDENGVELDDSISTIPVKGCNDMNIAAMPVEECINIDIPKILKTKYNKLPFNEVSLGYTTITIYPLTKIKDFVNVNWLVIGDEDLCGDLICIDTKTDSFPVYLVTLSGELEPDYLSSSFDNFVEILKMLSVISKGRDNPIKLEKNLVPKNIKNSFLNNIKEKNPNCDMQFWENIFEI